MNTQHVEKLGIVIIDSCKFANIESESPVIDVISLFLSQTLFLKCNYESKNFSVLAANAVEIQYMHCENSAGIKKSDEDYDNVKLFTSSVKKSNSQPISIRCASIELSNINISEINSKSAIAMGYGPHGLDARFITIASCNCIIATQLEADNGYTNVNQRYIYTRNNVSDCLLYSFRTICECHWFFFINNINPKITHSNNAFHFFNSFSTERLIGNFSGEVQVVPEVTEPLFPSVGLPRVLTECHTGTRLQLAFLSLFNHKELSF